MNLRRAQAEDAGKLAQVLVDAWQAAYRGVAPDSFLQEMTYQQREERLQKSLAAGPEETYLLEEEDRPVAVLTIGATRDADLDSVRTGEIGRIYVIPDRWRQGIGTALLREAEGMFRARGYGQIVLWVLEGNAQARRFYGAMGFALDGASKTVQLGAPLKAVRYRKTLL